jgi:hypothetical protein
LAVAGVISRHAVSKREASGVDADCWNASSIARRRTAM